MMGLHDDIQENQNVYNNSKCYQPQIFYSLQTQRIQQVAQGEEQKHQTIKLQKLNLNYLDSMKTIHKQSTNAEFHTFMTQLLFRKNQNFRATKGNLYRTIEYIHNMEITQKTFQVIEYLIKEFGVSVLLCFEPFYQKITKNHKARVEFKEKLERISSLVNCQVKPYKCGELKFFNIQGKSRKAFNVKQKTPEQIELMKELQFCRNCIIIKKQNPNIEKIPKDQQKHLKMIIKWIQAKTFNPFAQYYLHKMLKKVLNQYHLQKIEGSTADETEQERQERLRIDIEKDETTEDQYKFKEKKRTRSQQKRTEGIGTVKIKNQESNVIIGKNTVQNKISSTYKNQEKTQKQIQSTKKQQHGPNFALIPLCCRTFFFDQERILPGEDKRTEYKSYRFPFNPASAETFKKTICALLNTIGGQIYIGIKQTTNRKYRYVLGNYLTQNDKEQVLKSFRKISQAIFPNITQDLQVEFVPVRKTPFPDINLLGQVQTYFYDFSKKPLDLDKCPYRPARYVIRVRVPMGNRESMYSYVQTEYQLNRNTTSGEFIPFRSQNQVLVKEISQEVLRRYKQKLLSDQQPKNTAVHNGPCLRPEIGDPRNEPQPQDEVMDAKEIEAVLYPEYLAKKMEGMESNSESIKSFENENEKIAQMNLKDPVKTSTNEEMRTIFKYPLTFIVQRLPYDRLKRCIAKTPAITYTVISQEINQLTKQELILISIDAYSHMEQFLRVKQQLQKHFQSLNTQFVGVSKIIKLENSENKRIVEDLLIKNKHKYVINKRNLEFYSLIVAASYFLFMRNMGFRVEAIPD